MFTLLFMISSFSDMFHPYITCSETHILVVIPDIRRLFFVMIFTFLFCRLSSLECGKPEELLRQGHHLIYQKWVLGNARGTNVEVICNLYVIWAKFIGNLYWSLSRASLSVDNFIFKVRFTNMSLVRNYLVCLIIGIYTLYRKLSILNNLYFLYMYIRK